MNLDLLFKDVYLNFFNKAIFQKSRLIVFFALTYTCTESFKRFRRYNIHTEFKPNWARNYNAFLKLRKTYTRLGLTDGMTSSTRRDTVRQIKLLL